MHALYQGEANEEKARPGGSCEVARENTPQERRGVNKASESEDENKDEENNKEENMDEERAAWLSRHHQSLTHSPSFV